MKNKFLAAFLLLTPVFVIVLSTVFEHFEIAPSGRVNNGEIFEPPFKAVNIEPYLGEKELDFTDGKWTLGFYNLDSSEDQANALYLMRQINIALNRDINKVQRIIIFSNVGSVDANTLEEYPRTKTYIDINQSFKSLILENNSTYFSSPRIFLIDQYGWVAMSFRLDLNPKLILKDLKRIIK